ncbi:hypothetical protein JCM8547_008418 [Rhodosporidiobolus lusitaniae]
MDETVTTDASSSTTRTPTTRLASLPPELLDEIFAVAWADQLPMRPPCKALEAVWRRQDWSKVVLSSPQAINTCSRTIRAHSDVPRYIQDLSLKRWARPGVEEPPVDQEIRSALVELINAAGALKALRIEESQALSAIVLEEHLLDHLPRLEQLEICDPSERTLTSSTPSTVPLRSLTSLSFAAQYPTPHLVPLLRRCPRLTSLSLSTVGWTTTLDGHDLGQALAAVPSPSLLIDLVINDWGFESATPLAFDFGSLTSLQSLTLDDSSPLVDATAFRRLPIATLQLDDCGNSLWAADVLDLLSDSHAFLNLSRLVLNIWTGSHTLRDGSTAEESVEDPSLFYGTWQTAYWYTDFTLTQTREVIAAAKQRGVVVEGRAAYAVDLEDRCRREEARLTELYLEKTGEELTPRWPYGFYE